MPTNKPLRMVWLSDAIEAMRGGGLYAVAQGGIAGTPAVVVPDMTPEEARAALWPEFVKLPSWDDDVSAVDMACKLYPAAVLVLLAAALQKQEAPDES